VRVGIVGYSAREFDQEKAREILVKLFDELQEKHDGNVEIVSGLTALGVPLLAYQEARRRGWKTIGIACKKAYKYERFPVDEEIIVGDDWGDESETFLSMIDICIRIGGEEQSRRETEMAKQRGLPVLEYDL